MFYWILGILAVMALVALVRGSMAPLGILLVCLVLFGSYRVARERTNGGLTIPKQRATGRTPG
jgi:hypothetical protein